LRGLMEHLYLFGAAPSAVVATCRLAKQVQYIPLSESDEGTAMFTELNLHEKRRQDSKTLVAAVRKLLERAHRKSELV
jgi:hypothetical protein